MLFFMLTATTIFCSCEPKAKKTTKKLEDITEKYIDDLDNAQSKEEVSKINKEYKERYEFEANKLSDEEKEEYVKNQSWEERQHHKKLHQESVDARKRVKKRLNENQ